MLRGGFRLRFLWLFGRGYSQRRRDTHQGLWRADGGRDDPGLDPDGREDFHRRRGDNWRRDPGRRRLGTGHPWRRGRHVRNEGGRRGLNCLNYKEKGLRYRPDGREMLVVRQGRRRRRRTLFRCLHRDHWRRRRRSQEGRILDR